MINQSVIARPVRFQLLGRFGSWIKSGESEIEVGLSRQERAILAYLAMQPDLRETRERLAALIWGDGTDHQARHNLRQCILLLRKKYQHAGKDLLLVDRHSIRLRDERLDIDARSLLALSQSDQPGDPERAIACYRGEFLENFALDVGSFGDWLLEERARVNKSMFRVLERFVTRPDLADSGAAALRAAEKFVAADPLSEEAQRILVRMLARYHGQDAAVAQITSFATMLRKELGVEPQPETRRLMQEIRTGVFGPALREASAADRAARTDTSGSPEPTPKMEQSKSVALPPKAPWYRRTRVLSMTTSIVALLLVIGTIVPLLRDKAEPPGSKDNSQHSAADSWQSPGINLPALANNAIYPMIVLPFRTEVAGDNLEARFASRFTTDLINDLSCAPNARVISPQTSRLYGGTADIARIGAELGVRYVVEGDLRFEGPRLRLNVALTDVATRLQVWSDRFDRDQTDSLAVRDEMAHAITRRLQINIVAAEDRRRPPNLPAQPGIDDLLAKGWAATARISTADKNTGADTYFAKVLELDPDNVSALVGLGAFHVTRAVMFLAAEDSAVLTKAEGFLKRAIELEPRTSLAYYYLGLLEKMRGHPDAALQQFRTVLELNRSYAPAYAQVGHVLSRIGRLDEALDYVRYAVRLSPKDHNLAIWSMFGGQIELELGHDEAAIEWLSRAADAAPGSPFIQAALAAAFALRGDRELAAKHASETRRLGPWMTNEVMTARVVGLSAPGSEPRRLIRGLNIAFGNPG
jgi:DNA-binding SARP family transcriptional activator/TolB-like protein/Tfp pilus assembly protein PilF